jgi:hypothetical protein
MIHVAPPEAPARAYLMQNTLETHLTVGENRERSVAITAQATSIYYMHQMRYMIRASCSTYLYDAASHY